MPRCFTTVLTPLAVGLVWAAAAASQQLDADRQAVLALAEGALAAVSNEDLRALTDLMIDDAIVFSTSRRGDDVTYSVRTRAQERARSLGRDIVERGFDPEVRISGDLATVWLPYDLYADGAWSHCGIDVFTMLRTEGSWRIATMGWTVEQPPACRAHPSGPPSGSSGR